eukprot:TRINITY_DN1059_c0_g1_i3.p1 TRINITY_DN1059_c0_g1~~TRINITY_DN1059_c0_g1_i3.p1  ORF type:complete len:189 (+),score=-13.66 TRINITY_DN1059_c0_g1_i3:418-984(+)
MYLLAYKVYLFQGHIQNDQSLQTKVVGPILVPTFNQKEEIGQTFGLDQATFHFKKGRDKKGKIVLEQITFQRSEILNINMILTKYQVKRLIRNSHLQQQNHTIVVIVLHIYQSILQEYCNKFISSDLGQFKKVILITKSLFLLNVYFCKNQYLRQDITLTIIKVIFNKSNRFQIKSKICQCNIARYSS